MLLGANMLNAQPPSFYYVMGQVTDISTGNPIPNHPVLIQLDAQSTGVTEYVDTVFTNANGYYIDSIFSVNTNQPYTALSIVQDCNGVAWIDSGAVFYSQPGVTINHAICAPNQGQNCQAVIGYNIVGDSVYFQAYGSNGQNLNYFWDLGNGNTSNNIEVGEQYSYGQTVTVQLTVWNGTCADTTWQTITIPPGNSCQAGFQFIGAGGTSVNFYDSSFTTSSQVTLTWDFGDGNTTWNDPFPTHTYSQPGTYYVCLTVYDSVTACSDTYCDSVSVGLPNPCNADFSFQDNGLTVNFTDQSSGNYGFTEWHFGDGNSSTSANPSHTYAQGGTYPVTLYIYGNGCMDTLVQNVTVQANNNFCQALFNYVDLGNNVVSFTDLSQSSPFVTHFWDFGDNSTSTAQNPVHTYSQPGMYGVCLTITDSTGCTDSFCDTIMVDTTNQQPCQANQSHYVSGNTLYATNLSSGNYNSVEWVIAYSQPLGPQWIYSNNLTHTFQNPGVYQVFLIVQDTNGSCYDSLSFSVTIPQPGGGGGNTVSGLVSNGNNFSPVQNADVYLVTLDPNTNTLFATDTVSIVPADSGNYQFNNVSPGFYTVKAALTPQDPDYSSNLPTYLGDELMWYDATAINVGQNNSGNNITLVAGNNPGGPGFIAGNIQNGANKTTAGAENATVIFMDENNGQAVVGYTTTNVNGDYSMANLPYGTYRIRVDQMNYNGDDMLVTIGPGSEIQTGQNLTMTPAGATSTPEEALNAITELKLFPNPARSRAQLIFSTEIAEGYTLQVMNTTGARVLEQPVSASAGENSVELDIQAWPAGLYLVSLRSESGQTETRRLLIQR